MTSQDAKFPGLVGPPNARGCRMWQASTHRNGYGQFRHLSKGILAHRYAWIRVHGAIPAGAVVMHTCDVPGCVALAHLRLGTQADNVADMHAKGRVSAGERHAAFQRGSHNGRAKVRESDIPRIRERIAGGERFDDIGADYGVVKSTISRIHLRKMWGHVA